MLSLAILFLLTVVSFLIFIHISQRSTDVYKRTVEMFPGPKLLPILGNSHMFGSTEVSYKVLMSLSKQYERFYRLFIGGTAFVILYNYRDFERVLSTSVKLEKNQTYRFLWPWLGTGLLTSAGQKWKTRRKIISPAFHFKILESFIPLFNSNGILLCDKLAEKVGKGTFDVYPLIKLYALDNIYETAMKQKVNALVNSESAYVKAVREVAVMVIARSFSFFLSNDIIFNMSKYGKIQRNALKVLHDTTKQVVRERRKELEEIRKQTKNSEDQEIISDNMPDEKKRLVFLDILLSSQEGFALSDEDICEEVNTFMFEGHDTVSSGISFALYALAHNPSIQETAYQEQLSIFGDDDRPPTSSDIQEMTYLEMVLKESQRLYPSVPFIGRYVHEDIPLSDGYVLPKGSQINLLISALHRDPKVWPDPDTFNPDNFLPDAMSKRSPYAYVPFSAGERNCIGRRFALLEMKSCLSKILRRFKLHPSPKKEDDVNLIAELVLVSTTGVKIQIEERK